MYFLWNALLLFGLSRRHTPPLLRRAGSAAGLVARHSVLLLSAGGALLAAVWRPQQQLFQAIVCLVLLIVALIDLRTRRVPNRLIYPATVALIVHAVGSTARPLPEVLAGSLFAFFVFFATYLLRPAELGGGDVKLALLIGVYLGFPEILWALLLSGVSGAIVLGLLAASGQRRRFPYAPYLCFGAIVATYLDPLTPLLPYAS